MPRSSQAPPAHTPRRLHSRWSLPLIAGSLIAAAGLVFGGLATASAHDGGGNSASDVIISPTPAPPNHGDAIPNVTRVENEIKAYYGVVPTPTTIAGIGDITESLPDPNGLYAKEMHGVEADAQNFLRHADHGNHNNRGAKPALVFDIDDTTLNTFNYEIFSTFAFNPTTNADFVNDAAFPAVFGMPALVDWAGSHGYTVFFLTGRPTTQRPGTVTNLTKVGYTVPLDVAHVFLKPTATDPLPAYLPCATIALCTTTQYKSATRAHIESLGFNIVANFGDQFSDLNGGFADRTFKLPNPMYFLP